MYIVLKQPLKKIIQSCLAKKAINKPKRILSAILKCQNKIVRKNKDLIKQKGQTKYNPNIKPTLPTITFNVNRLNTATRSKRMLEWIEKQDQNICCFQEIHFKYKGRLKVSGWEKLYHASNKKKAGVAMLISDKADFKTNYFRIK